MTPLILILPDDRWYCRLIRILVLQISWKSQSDLRASSSIGEYLNFQVVNASTVKISATYHFQQFSFS